MDELPGNAGTPPVGAAGQFLAGGRDAAGPQADALTARARTGLFFGAVPQGRPIGSPVDLNSPQRFANRPSLEELLNATSIGDDSAAESLPGRIRPVSFGDGEESWSNNRQVYPR
jgi:hypothetical protein